MQSTSFVSWLLPSFTLMRRRLVVDGPWAAGAVQVKLLHFLYGERPRADASEYRDLAAGLVDRGVAVQAFRDGERRLGGLVPRDQLRLRRRAEAVEIRLVRGTHQLHHLEKHGRGSGK